MRLSTKTTSFALALSFAVLGYVAFRIAKKVSSSVPPQASEIPLKAPFAEKQLLQSTPQPPPKPFGEPVNPPIQDPQRALVGTTVEQLELVERRLPAGARIATYPISEIEQRAALASSDLTSDGNTETVVIYNSPGPKPAGGAQPLFLGVLISNGNNLVLRATTTLYGGLIYISLYDKQTIPFAVRDVTGDGRPEIIVTSGVGASLGGALQVYAFDGSSLHQIANAVGHILHVNYKGPAKPSEITAVSRYEASPRIYRWNGHEFRP